MRKFSLLGAAAAYVLNPVAVSAAEEADTPTLLAYLGLSAADGKTSVGENAAAVEAAMLVSALAVAAATKIKDNISDAAAGNSIVFVAKDEKFSLLPYRQAVGVLDRLELQVKEFDKLDLGSCKTKTKDLPNPSLWSSVIGVPETSTAPKFNLKPSDILGAFRTSTELTGAPFDPSIELIKASLSASAGDLTWSSPIDVVDAPNSLELRNRLAKAEATVKPYSGKNCPGNEDISKSADAVLAVAATLTASKEGTPSLLDHASAAAPFAQKPNLRVLRFDVTKAGGTLVNASNIWTSLGVPGLTMRGGLVTSYRLINPATGVTEAAGIVSCRYPNQLLIRINKTAPKPEGAKCETIASVKPPTRK